MKTLEPYQEQVLIEQQDLNKKLINLLTFFHSSIFSQLSKIEQSRLNNQARYMSGYLAMLDERIADF